MNGLVHNNAHLFRCPDDRSHIYVHSLDFLRCEACGRRFETYGGNFVSLLPKEPYKGPSTYQNRYEEDFFRYYFLLSSKEFKRNTEATAWGAPENMPVVARRRKLGQVSQMMTHFQQGSAIVCDVSAGAGYFSLPMSTKARVVMSCDLDVNNLNYLMNKAAAEQRGNILFVRSDLFAPPFAPNCFDTVICTDTLIYGDLMVQRFLSAIVASLANGGIALVDFYNRTHRNPFHAPYLLGYSRKECEMMLRTLGDVKFAYEGFFQEFSGRLRWIIPPTRHIFKLTKGGTTS